MDEDVDTRDSPVVKGGALTGLETNMKLRVENPNRTDPP